MAAGGVRFLWGDIKMLSNYGDDYTTLNILKAMKIYILSG